MSNDVKMLWFNEFFGNISQRSQMTNFVSVQLSVELPLPVLLDCSVRIAAQILHILIPL